MGNGNDMEQQTSTPLVGAGDVARWFTFGGFWGFVFYLLSFAGMLTGHRRQPVHVNVRTVSIGMGIHVGIFVGLTSLFSLLQSLVTGKSSRQIAQERIGGGTLEQSVLKLALSGGTGSVIPFLIARQSLHVAKGITGYPAFESNEDLNWARSVGVTAVLSGITAMAVARITSWVAQDARTGSHQKSA